MKFQKLIVLFLIIGCQSKKEITSEIILKNSFTKHDPTNNIENLEFNLRVQEPRLQNYDRFSNVKLNNKTGEFTLERNRDSFVSKHIIDANGNATTLLNNKIIKDSLLIKKYRLDPKRNFGYKRYYQFFSLLPMSLQNEEYKLSNVVLTTTFNKKIAYKIPLTLEKSFFSKHWNLFFDINDFTFLGVEMVFPNDKNKGERIFFEGQIVIDNVIIPRFHHWHELNGIYSGSDIIVKEIK